MIKQYAPIKFLSYFVVIFLLLVSCKSTKIPSDGVVNSKLAAKVIVKEHYKNALQFKTARGKLKINYNDGKTNQGFSLSFRMEKDKAIWMSATLDLVKIYITPGRIAFYNRLQNEYFDGDFTFLSELLGTDLDFQQVQNLLLGQSLLDLNNDAYTVKADKNVYELKPKKAGKLFEMLFQLEPKHFKMAKQELSQPSKNRVLQINYKNYQQIENRILPREIFILAEDAGRKSMIDIEYRNVVFDQRLKFPFKIPKGFREIVLKKDDIK